MNTEKYFKVVNPYGPLNKEVGIEHTAYISFEIDTEEWDKMNNIEQEDYVREELLDNGFIGNDVDYKYVQITEVVYKDIDKYQYYGPYWSE